MKKVLNGLLAMDTHDSLVRVLQSWRLWMAGAMIGALVAYGVYAVFPPDYRAKSVVVVDHNLEQAWNVSSGEASYFLTRETRKLLELAWSDETLGLVADRVGEVSVQELRDEILQLSQPEDGGWYFYANSPSASQAEKIAATWAEVFYQQTYEAVEVSAEVEQMRREINEVLERYPGLTVRDISKLIDRDFPTLYSGKGISHFIELDLAQTENLTVDRSVALSVYLLSGSVIGASGLALAALIFLRAKEKDAQQAEERAPGEMDPGIVGVGLADCTGDQFSLAAERDRQDPGPAAGLLSPGFINTRLAAVPYAHQNFPLAKAKRTFDRIYSGGADLHICRRIVCPFRTARSDLLGLGLTYLDLFGYWDGVLLGFCPGVSFGGIFTQIFALDVCWPGGYHSLGRDSSHCSEYVFN